MGMSSPEYEASWAKTVKCIYSEIMMEQFCTLFPKDGSKVMEAHISTKAKTNTHGVGEGEGEATSTQTQQAGRPVRTARPWY